MAGFRGKWINVETEIKNENITNLLQDYDKLITQYVDIIPLSDILDQDDTGMMGKLFTVYKSTLDLCNDAFEVMITQDNMNRHIMEQNNEILKKLDKLSEKTTK